MMRSGLALLLILLHLLTGCTQAPEALPPRITTHWGPATALAAAETLAAPVALAGAVPWLAWAGADDAEVRLYAARPPQAAPRILALRAFYAHSLSLWLAANDFAHLLWIDRDERSGETRLKSALLNNEPRAEIGPTLLADAPTRHYAAAALEDGALQVVWSGGVGTWPALSTQTIDPRGRAGFPQRLGPGDHPALVAASDGTLILYWIDEGGLYGALLAGEILLNTRRLAPLPALRAGDRVEALYAAHDARSAYLFVQLVRSDGTPELWWTQGAPNAARWEAPARFSFALLAGQIETTYNSGPAQPARTDTAMLARWGAPLPGEEAVQAIAVQQEDALYVLYLRDGALFAGQRLLEDLPALLAPPTLARDRDRHLLLSWTVPRFAQPAVLHFVSTRR